MKSKINFTAIIAVAMIAMSVLVLGSCNADDDDYNFEYGTLAKGVMTRGAETPPQPKLEVISDTTTNSYIIELHSDCPEISKGKYIAQINTMIYYKDNIPTINLLSYKPQEFVKNLIIFKRIIIYIYDTRKLCPSFRRKERKKTC